MEDAGHGEHPDDVEENGRPDGEPAPADPDYTQTTEVQDDERDTANEVNPIGLRADAFRGLKGVVGIDPLDQGGAEAAQGGFN